VLPNDELWFVGQNAGRLTYYGAAGQGPAASASVLHAALGDGARRGMLLFGAQRGRIGRMILT
jgi:hypothetical protein